MNIFVIAPLIGLSLALIAYAMWPRGHKADEAVKRRMRGGALRGGVIDSRRQSRESVAHRVMKRVAPVAVRPVMMKNPEDVSKLRLRLANAGMRTENATTVFLASKTVSAIGFGLIAALYAWSKGGSIQMSIGIVLFGAGLGFMAPNFWLNMAVKKRQEMIRNGLPDTLDLMVISVEAGLGLDAAIQRVSDEMRRVHPILAEEMQIVSLESQMGIPRSEALGNCVDRSGVEELRSLVAIINQAERFGSSIARALRNQSDALRTKRRQAAEERAQKTTVKLMVPLILFIFPAILVFLAGPAALKLMDAFSSNSAFGGG
jgi:tight adherence protein C